MLLSYFAVKDDLPKSAWLVSKIGRVTAGVQYEPHRKYYADLIPIEIF
jgi:hypothetical protein